MEPSRRLAAILFTDIVGSTAMMQKDEQTAVSTNKRYVEVLQQSVGHFHGEILNDYGDGSLSVFSSATEALRCSIEMQRQFQNAPKVPLRIGVHVGEIFFDNGKVFGNGVNVASRVQSLGIANSILFSSQIHSQIKNQQEFKSVSIGYFNFKHVDEAMEIFALVNEGLAVPRKEELTGKLKEVKKKSVIGKWIAATLVLSLILVSYLVYKKVFHMTGFSGERTIAVLPFENVGRPDSEEYISDGITQDIINDLSKITSLQKVIAWLSVRGFKNSPKSLKQIADELDVAAILSGTIEKHGGKVHINAELVEVSTNKRLWGDNFEYNDKDILSIQSRVVGEIISAFKVNLTPEEKSSLKKNYTDDPEAYKLYRKGLFFWNKNGGSFFDSAVLYYKKAIDIDPDYALAYSGLANCYIFFKLPSQLEGIPIARMYAAKALSLDSNLCEAMTTLGFIQSNFDYDWATSKMTLQKAIRLNPNYSEAHLFYGNVLQYSGESTERGIQEVKRALELDPLNTRFNWILGRNYYLARQYNLAEEQLKKTLNLWPDHSFTKETLSLVYLQEKKFTDAFALIRQLPPISPTVGPDQIYYLCYAEAASGDTSHAKAVLEKIIAGDPEHNPLLLAYIYIALKNYDEALRMLELAYNKRHIQLFWIKIDPILDPIRNENRFKAVLQKMHLD